ncbi:uncharacterized protein AB675_7059 [Cyphellophora attinorum]|uniref:Tumor susceptibility gene 101 protein n=1 Tax=Cyphellophora attinorum TaxID=1664694 RepID=A0A0N1P0F3_9EURO|nr:uncharacterized protein AB675_7059 [Phialophora attinorum]KPI43473.1 hypothetical protein AB675_7059 [Phialophora attinorum]
MAQVPQSTLRYLFHDVLKSRLPYHDPNRAYSDIVSTLQRYPGITVKGTKEYIFDNGKPELLLYLGGVLPVSFRGSLYHFPILIWIPYAYPYEAPIIYVDPSDDIAVNPGQHVATDGKIYHHYLAHWRETWDRSHIVEFLGILSDVFAKEPPVRSRSRPIPPPHQQSPAPPPRPPLPHEAPPPRPPPPQSPGGGPPPPPPKEPSANGRISSPAQPRPGRYDAPPPLPSQSSSRPTSTHQQQPQQPRPPSQYQSQRSTSLRQSHPQQPPPPQNWQQPPQPQQFRQAPLPNQYQQAPQRHPSQHLPHQPGPRQPPLQQQQAPQAKPPPGPDLLGSPFDLPLPNFARPAENLPAPPIPRNPEKDALLSHLSTILTNDLHQQIQQSTSQLPALQAQTAALTSTKQTLQAELSALAALQASLQSNITALSTSLSSASSAITDAQRRAAKNDLPAVDAMLTTPHIVSQQLYTAVAEERGIEAAIWGLQEALIGGRVGSEVWSRRTRELGREEFRRKWVVRKAGRGWGLEGL